MGLAGPDSQAKWPAQPQDAIRIKNRSSSASAPTVVTGYHIPSCAEVWGGLGVFAMREGSNPEESNRTKLPPKKEAAGLKPPVSSQAPKGRPLPTDDPPPFAARPLEEPRTEEKPADKEVPQVADEEPQAIEVEPQEETEEVERLRIRKKKQPSGVGAFFSGLPTRPIPLYVAVLLMIIPMVIVAWAFYDLGSAGGLEQAEEAATKEGAQLPPEISAKLDGALIALRNGDSPKAVRDLQEVEREPLNYPSVTYLLALAAMQDGNIDLSEKKVQASIDKRERISDALALQAVLETQKAHDPSRAKMVDPRKRAEIYLRQAIVADAANPYPHFELASLLRHRGEREEALREVKAAEARLNPVDSHTIMGLTMALMELENMPPDQLPPKAVDSDDIQKLFPSAYAEMRRGDFATAAVLLRKCRKLSAPDIFDYAVNDPAIRKYARQPELAEFYQANP